ncbi:MAG: gliding motility-associated C-terminal domain-containing protein, partial [Flavobacteriales bacterium]|nr:gliding motility-associated C-terminal domain-containing protein [Flavobacteriales bacterium]
LPGTACDDGDATTGNDTLDGSCNCVGLLIDCEGTAGGSALPGTACDDGDATNGNDTWDGSCNCLGQLIDCEGTAGGSALPGTTCDDGDATTGSDTWDVNCDCAGLLIDCEGTAGGAAFVDACGDCVGGNTGLAPCADDCNGDPGGTASIDQCGVCSGGNSGITPNSTCLDCNGDINGTASIDQCGVCSGGNSGITPNTTCLDCNGDINGTAGIDQCGVCSGGNTGVTPNSTCLDCNGDINGTAGIDQCGVCSGGNTGVTPNSTCLDCNGDINGTASIDQCGVCSGGNSGVTPNSTCLDCNGDINGSAFVDNCGNCVGGNTGLTACTEDCNGIWGGAALPGTACDDGDPCTVNDTWDATCACSGTPFWQDPYFAYAETEYCSTMPDPTPAVVTTGGFFSAAPSGLVLDPGSGTIDLGGSMPGQYIVTYSLGTDCVIQHQDSVNILTVPDASWTTPGVVCTGEVIDLSALVTGTSGGSWSGPGVNGSSFFASNGPGQYDITYSVENGGCENHAEESIQVVSGPVADAGPDEVVCGTSHTLAALLSNAVGSWTGPVGASFIPSVNDPNALITVPAPGSYSLIWTVGDGQCSASDTVLVTFLDPETPIWADAGADQDLSVFTATELNGSASPGAQTLWSLLSGSGYISNPSDLGTSVTDLGVGANVFILTAVIGDCATASDMVLVHVKDLFIPQGFSPNNDGVNDTWEITGIEAYPENELTVYDRWGRPVYSATDYDNSWNGHSSNGHALIDDTYFYVLNLPGDRPYNGYVIIKR